jgi:hypothetical protein
LFRYSGTIYRAEGIPEYIKWLAETTSLFFRWLNREALFITCKKLGLTTHNLGMKSKVSSTTFGRLTEKCSHHVCTLFYKFKSVTLSRRVIEPPFRLMM